MNLKKAYKALRTNYFISIFLAAIIFVGLVSAYKLFFARSTYVYARVKIGQGLWWATTAKPSIWLAKSIKSGDKQYDLLGKPIVQVLKARYYPSKFENQFDVYLDLKLKVSANKKTQTYNFNRSTIGVGSAIDLELPSTQVSGTIAKLSPTPFNEKYVDKIIYLTEAAAYPWEYDAIQIGDSFFDGEQIVFKILDKWGGDQSEAVVFDKNSATINSTPQARRYISVKAELKTVLEDGQYIFGGEQVVRVGNQLVIATSNFNFNNFYIGAVQ